MTFTFGQVFLIILALVIIAALGYMAGKAKQPKNNLATASYAPLAPAAPAAVFQAGGIRGETVAVISAAVAAFMADTAPGTPYKITGIAPSRQAGRSGYSRPVWGFAGMRQNTEQF